MRVREQIKKIWRKIDKYRKLRQEISEIERGINQLENTAKHGGREVINLATGLNEINLDAEIRREYAIRRLKELKAWRSKLERQQEAMIFQFEKIYRRLKAEYTKEYAKFDFVFQRYIHQLLNLERTWNKMTKDGELLSNMHRTLWELGTIIGKADDKIKTVLPFKRWQSEMTAAFTRLHNYLEEVGEHGGR